MMAVAHHDERCAVSSCHRDDRAIQYATHALSMVLSTEQCCVPHNVLGLAWLYVAARLCGVVAVGFGGFT